MKSFLIKCFTELIKRTNINIEVLNKVKYISPINILMENSRFDNFPIELAENPQDVQDEWRIFNLTDFNEYFNNSIPNKSLEFWVSIYHYKDSVGPTCDNYQPPKGMANYDSSIYDNERNQSNDPDSEIDYNHNYASQSDTK
ncbi:hypothetical protein A3Q56_00861 [Intoshia linei]|uniref:Uncharacterized protein n=1 Tax=Intoshia linei TaxID=1819745 RepID=A0A177BAM6_9BILA|nr:hypothetical protein A3Q56_00861 [Intoshia linei]